MILSGGTPRSIIVLISSLLAQSKPAPSWDSRESKTGSLSHFIAVNIMILYNICYTVITRTGVCVCQAEFSNCIYKL